MRHADPFRAETEARLGASLRGKWRIDPLLDVGGMAAVYAATHRNGNRVAVKALRERCAGHTQARERSQREGYVANKVGHRNAVAVLDDDELDDGTAVLVMELLGGETLEQRLARSGTLSTKLVLASRRRSMTSTSAWCSTRRTPPFRAWSSTSKTRPTLVNGSSCIAGARRRRTAGFRK